MILGSFGGCSFNIHDPFIFTINTDMNKLCLALSNKGMRHAAPIATILHHFAFLFLFSSPFYWIRQSSNIDDSKFYLVICRIFIRLFDISWEFNLLRWSHCFILLATTILTRKKKINTNNKKMLQIDNRRTILYECNDI